MATMDTFLKSSAASISSMTYRGVGLKWCKAKTSASEESVFSPPDRLLSMWGLVCLDVSRCRGKGAFPGGPTAHLMFFQLFFGGRTEKTMPSENGSRESTSSNSASPPNVII